MKLIGIDPSIRSAGVCLLVDGKARTKTISEPPGKPMDLRLYRFWSSFAYAAKHHRDTIAVGIEGFAFGAFGKSRGISAVVEIVGVARVAFAEYGIPVVQIANATWRSITMGKVLSGHAKRTVSDRAAYCEAIRVRWGVRFATTDEADAFLIAKALERIILGQANDTDAVRSIRAELDARGVELRESQRELFAV